MWYICTIIKQEIPKGDRRYYVHPALPCLGPQDKECMKRCGKWYEEVVLVRSRRSMWPLLRVRRGWQVYGS